MSAPNSSNVVLHPPHPNMTKEEDDFFNKEMYRRSGGLVSATVNLKGLKASVAELNASIGIKTSTTIQKQLNTKANAADLGTISSQDADNVAITGGSIEDTSVQGSEIKTRAGLSVSYLNVSATLTANMVSVGNTAGVETDLITYTMAANTLSQANMYIVITAFGTIASNANLKELKLVLGSTTLYATGSLAANGGFWQLQSKIIRVGAANEKCISTLITDNALFSTKANYVSGAENLAANLIIKCTGNGVATDDIVQEGLTIEWLEL